MNHFTPLNNMYNIYTPRYKDNVSSKIGKRCRGVEKTKKIEAHINMNKIIFSAACRVGRYV